MAQLIINCDMRHLARLTSTALNSSSSHMPTATLTHHTHYGFAKKAKKVQVSSVKHIPVESNLKISGKVTLEKGMQAEKLLQKQQEE